MLSILAGAYVPIEVREHAGKVSNFKGLSIIRSPNLSAGSLAVELLHRAGTHPLSFLRLWRPDAPLPAILADRIPSA